MAFVRAAAVAAPVVVEEPTEVLVRMLSGDDVGERRRAARSLARDPDNVLVLASRLDKERDPGVLDALFGSLVRIGGARTAGLISGLLRSDDAGLRGGAIEALKRMRDDAVPALDALLGDNDPDTRLLAVEVTRAWPAALAVPRLRNVFENDPHVNVCGAAVDVATELGTRELLASLAGLRARFASDQFLVFAVDVACSRIRTADETAS